MIRALTILLFTSNFIFAQYWGAEEVDESNLTNWTVESKNEYTGTYLFGDSENESEFHLFFSGDWIIGQVRSGDWDQNTGIWKNNYITLTNICIDKKGKFSSDQYFGQFIKYKTDAGHEVIGLKIDNPWMGFYKYSDFEIGEKTALKFDAIYNGKYIEASSRKLNLEELKLMNSEELKLMKNEIFARYGYTFKKGGKMDHYFRKQKWYKAQYKKVKQFLTKIELYNIEFIKQNE